MELSIQNPSVNLPRALVSAMLLVTGLYMLTNVAYLTTMSRVELLESPAVAAVSFLLEHLYLSSIP